MKNYLFTALLVLFLVTSTITAQRNCGTMDYLEQQLLEHPEMLLNMEQVENHTRQFIQNGAMQREVVTIPVVVHVVYRTGAENISEAQVQSQIDVLNEDFRRTNTDQSDTPPQFSNVAADTEIQFCLASVDPEGNATNGITYTQTGKRSFRTNDDMKRSRKGGIDPWPTGDYLNIWVCNLSNGILGYAQFPGGPAATDGVVCHFNAFGSVDDGNFSLFSSYNLGRTTTHEVGHWLNLRHIWGDGGCGVDDFVGDTPTAGGPNYTGSPCNYPGPNSCSDGGEDLPDMFQNYMDYSNDACMNLYTTGQKGRMHALFTGSRASLLNSNGCGDGTPPGPGPEICGNGIDDDLDGDTDCDDSDCSGAANCQPTGSCDAPTGLSAYNIKRKRANVRWSAATGASNYTVEYRVENSNSNWNSKTTSGTSTSISGLNNNTTYEWRVSADCSDASAICSFIAGNSGSGACGNGRFSGEATNDLTLFPNPATNWLMVEINSLSTEKRYLNVIDTNGKTLKQYTVDSETDQLELNVADLASGLYLVRIMDKDGEMKEARKFLIHR